MIAGDFAGVPYQPDDNLTCSQGDIDSSHSYVDAYFTSIHCQYPSFQPSWWAYHAWGDLERYERSMDTKTDAPITSYMDSEINYEAEVQLNETGALKLWNTETGAWYKEPCDPAHFFDTRDGKHGEYLCDEYKDLIAKVPDGKGSDGTGTRDYWWGMDHQASSTAFLQQTTSIASDIQGVLYYDYQRGDNPADAGLAGSPWDYYAPADLADPSYPGQTRAAFCMFELRYSTSNPKRFDVEHQPPSCTG